MEFSLKPFNSADQAWFAEQTGDYNPIHVNALDAASSSFGQVLVHGIHVVLRALNGLCDVGYLDKFTSLNTLSIKVDFGKPVHLGEVVRVIEAASTKDKSVLHLMVGTLRVFVLEFSDTKPAQSDYHDVPNEPPVDFNILQAPMDVLPSDCPQQRTFLVNVKGGEESELHNVFDKVATYFGKAVVHHFAATSSLVGMILPGKYSLFLSLNFSLKPSRSEVVANEILYSLLEVHTLFSCARLRAVSSILQADITALFRPRPVEQLPYSALRNSQNDRPDLLGKKCLVIGGSRGLGALCVKLLKRAGADVTFTYHKNVVAAEAIIADINEENVRHIQLDVTKPVQPNLLQEKFDQIYYFATPHIFARKTKDYEPELLLSFLDVYVTGFERIHANLSKRSTSLFYPSSIEVESNDVNTIEYRIAKLAGETLCETLAKKFSDQCILVKRLPRLNTDQTAQIQNIATEDSLVIMSEIILSISGKGQKSK